MKLKANIGRLEIKEIGLTLTAKSSDDDIKRALKHKPHLDKFIDGTKPVKSDGGK
jgi:hypothetical protein